MRTDEKNRVMTCRQSEYLFVHKLLLFLLLIFCSNAYGAEYPVLGRDKLPDVVMTDDHSDVLAYWMKKGIQDAILINIDAHHDMSPAAPGKMERLKVIHTSKDIASFQKANSLNDEGLYHSGNFIYVAAKLGMVKEVYWVTPFRHFSRAGNEKQLKKLLTGIGFSDSDIQNFRMIEGCIRGSVSGIPLCICTIESMPSITHPVIVSIDTDFLPSLSAEYGIGKLKAALMLLETLKRKSYRVIMASVSYSFNGGYTIPINGWLGDVIMNALKSQGVLPGKTIPAMWSAYQKADQYSGGYLPEKTIAFLTPLLRQYASDPWLLLYAADAYYQRNDTGKAFEYAEKVCINNKRNCFGLPYLGRYLLREGRIADADKFFEKGYRLYPGMIYYQWEMAFAYKKAGRFKDAMRYYERLRPLAGVFPADLFIGEIHLLLREREIADMHCRMAIEALSQTRDEGRDFSDVGTEIAGAAMIYEREGLGECSKMLRNEQSLRHLFMNEISTYKPLN